ncbi:unnamed protein product [Spodoptera exigua]|nr:unnamed protein product [Spodoptera exigua]
MKVGECAKQCPAGGMRAPGLPGGSRALCTPTLAHVSRHKSTMRAPPTVGGLAPSTGSSNGYTIDIALLLKNLGTFSQFKVGALMRSQSKTSTLPRDTICSRRRHSVKKERDLDAVDKNYLFAWGAAIRGAERVCAHDLSTLGLRPRSRAAAPPVDTRPVTVMAQRNISELHALRALQHDLTYFREIC